MYKIAILLLSLALSTKALAFETKFSNEPREIFDKKQAEEVGVFINISETKDYKIYIFNFNEFDKCSVAEVVAKMSFSNDSYFETRLVKEYDGAYLLKTAPSQEGKLSLTFFCLNEFGFYELNLRLK